MNCKNCSHWTSEAPFNLPEDYVQRVCGSQKIVEGGWVDDDDAKKTDMLHYSYREGGAFYTGPDFGCVHFKEKK